jgi:hypothetical protein
MHIIPPRYHHPLYTSIITTTQHQSCPRAVVPLCQGVWGIMYINGCGNRASHDHDDNHRSRMCQRENGKDYRMVKKSLDNPEFLYDDGSSRGHLAFIQQTSSTNTHDACSCSRGKVR